MPVSLVLIVAAAMLLITVMIIITAGAYWMKRKKALQKDYTIQEGNFQNGTPLLDKLEKHLYINSSSVYMK